jgi:phosphate transport system substrate-binding protein
MISMARTLFLLPILVSVPLTPIQVAAQGREEIRIVGSEPVLGFVQPVAQRFALNFDRPTPSIEITGTGTGLELFCAGVGFEHPDIVAASRRITPAELDKCRRNGVSEIVEIEFGLDGLVLVSAGHDRSLDLHRKELFQALARELPGEHGIHDNPNQRWSEIDPRLPDTPIRVIGPPPDATVKSAFLEMVMATGCEAFPALRSLPEAQRYQLCRSLRRDSAFINGYKSEPLILEYLEDETDAIGIVSYSVFETEASNMTAHAIEGTYPDSESISAGRYPLARPMYLYAKRRHVASVPALQDLLYELTSERSIAPDGYLVERGMVPLDDIARNRARDNVLSLRPFSLE